MIKFKYYSYSKLVRVRKHLINEVKEINKVLNERQRETGTNTTGEGGYKKEL